MERRSLQKTKTKLITNSLIELGVEEDEGKGKGRYFVSKFIEAGLAHYKELGDIVITKETLDKFIQTMVGCPVIIDHEDVTDKNVEELRVGVISKVWYNEYDGWYYCEGIITDKEAINLIKNEGWSVSCAYSFVSDDTKKTYHGKPIDMEFIDGEFLHLAIVKEPRYEGANIVVNKKDEDIEWITVKGNHIPVKKGQSRDEAVKEFIEERNKNFEKQAKSYKESREHAEKQLELVERKLKEKNSPQKHEDLVAAKKDLEDKIKYYKEQEDKQKSGDSGEAYKNPKTHDDLKPGERYNIQGSGIWEVTKKEGYKIFAREVKQGVPTGGEYYFADFSYPIEKWSHIEKDSKQQLNRDKIKISDKELNKKISSIAPSSKKWDWEPGYKEITVYFNDPKSEKANKQWDDLIKELKPLGIKDVMIARNDIGDITMTVLNDLTDFIKKVVSNEKEDKMKVENEDKRKLIDEIGGILKDKVDDEVIRTIIKKAEELSYEPSEDDKADNKKAKNEEDEDKKDKTENKCKNEEDKKEDKKVEDEEDKKEKEEDITKNEDEDEEDKKEVKNSMKDFVMGGKGQYEEKSIYTSRAKRLEEGNKY